MNQTPVNGYKTSTPLMLAAMVVIGMVAGQQLPRYSNNFEFQSNSASSSTAGYGGTLEEILKYVDAKYVDTLNDNVLRREAINQLLSKLDPHSVYISPEELQAVEEDMQGNFEGIGIEFILLDDTIQVVTPLSGGPSEAVGIMAGDKIVRISDTLVAGVKIDNGRIFKLLRGVKGSPVKIGVRRGNEKTERQFEIIRDVIPIHTVEASMMLDDKTGYIRVTRFNAKTYQEFMEAFRILVEEKGLKNLVLDLRNNPGGYLNEATEMLSQFFQEGKLLVYTEGRTEPRKDYKSNGRARFNIDQIAVLIDEGSASASEIVAGAIQDHDRGWVIGRRSFGKGLVQEQYPLHNGGALRLTVARYFTPSGRCIQREYKKDAHYDEEAERRLKSGELSDGAKIKIADSTAFYTGMGRVVYGGGGITPDIFIPADTSYFNAAFFKMRQQIPGFCARYMETHKAADFPATVDEFVAKYQVSEPTLEEFVAYCQKNGGKSNAQLVGSSKSELKLQIKARLAKLLFKDEGLFKVLNYEDPMIDVALKTLKNSEPLVKK